MKTQWVGFFNSRDDRRDGELAGQSIEIVQPEEQREGRLQNEEPPWLVGR